VRYGKCTVDQVLYLIDFYRLTEVVGWEQTDKTVEAHTERVEVLRRFVMGDMVMH
jgi:hypothetical protein